MAPKQNFLPFDVRYSHRARRWVLTDSRDNRVWLFDTEADAEVERDQRNGEFLLDRATLRRLRRSTRVGRLHDTLAQLHRDRDEVCQ